MRRHQDFHADRVTNIAMSMQKSVAWISSKPAEQDSNFPFTADGGSRPSQGISSSAWCAFECLGDREPRLVALGAVVAKDAGPLMAELGALELPVATMVRRTCGQVGPLVPHKVEAWLTDESVSEWAVEAALGSYCWAAHHGAEPVSNDLA